jgi:tight adherence protein C
VTFLFIIGLLFLGGAAACLVRAASLTRMRLSSQMEQIRTYGFNADEAVMALPLGEPAQRSPLAELAERIGSSVGGKGWRAPVEARMLRAAGMYHITPETFHGYRVMATAALPTFLLITSLLGGKFTATTFLLLFVGTGLCWVGPQVLVRTRGERRMDKVDRALPELIDVLTATIEAGLGFAGSLQMVAERFDGPLGQELRLTQREQSMGLSTERALSNMLERCDTPSVRAFVRAVTQGESLGVSIGTMMRNLASETRKRRRQAAQAKIQKAPVKMLFPLVFMIFPSLLIVLLYPAVTHLTHALGTG